MKYKILEMLKSADGFVSGEELSKKLGISRSGIWKNINSLRKDGFEINSVPSKGYVLGFAPDRINPEIIKKSVPGKVYYFNSVDSTNIEAKRAENVPDKSVFIAETQTGGRGRLGRKWTSPSGCGICMSLYLEPEISAGDVSVLTLVAGLSVCRAIKGSRIKWPNDVLIGDKKICGILTEMSAEIDRVNRVIVGIGVNVNNEVFGIDLIEKATSLYRETCRKHSREKLAADILSEFFGLYDKFLEKGFEALKDEYAKKCVTLNREVVIIRNGIEQSAYAVDITENGELLVEVDGKSFAVNSGEVSVRGLLGYN